MTNAVLKKVKIRNVENTVKQGKKGDYISTRIQLEGENFVRFGFGGEKTSDWVEGKEVLLVLFEDEWQGKKYQKFKVPNDIDLLKIRVKRIEQQLGII